MPKIRLISRDNAHELWDSIPRDDSLTYSAWNSASVSLSKTLADYGVFTGGLTSPTDFWIGEDWFQSRQLGIVAYSWKLISPGCFDAIQSWIASGFSGWFVRLVCDCEDHPDHRKSDLVPEFLFVGDAIVCSLINGRMADLIPRLKSLGFETDQQAVRE